MTISAKYSCRLITGPPVCWNWTNPTHLAQDTEQQLDLTARVSRSNYQGLTFTNLCCLRTKLCWKFTCEYHNGKHAFWEIQSHFWMLNPWDSGSESLRKCSIFVAELPRLLQFTRLPTLLETWNLYFKMFPRFRWKNQVTNRAIWRA